MSWYSRLYDQKDDDVVDERLGSLFDYINDAETERRFNEVNKGLKLMEIARINVILLVGILTMCYAAKHELSAYDDFLQRVRIHLELDFDPDQIEEILVGFDTKV